MDLFEDLKMSLFSFNFFLIYIIHKMLILLKNHLNHLKSSIFECKEYNSLLLLFFLMFFFTTYNDGKFKSWRRK